MRGRNGDRAGFRLIAGVASLAMLFSIVAPMQRPAQAQAVPSDTRLGDAPQAGDPPGRVGRVARMSGTVSFHSYDQENWDAATLNFPVTSGNAFWTQPGASADLDLGGARVTLDQGTEFTVDTLDDTHLAATAGQGHVLVVLRDLQPGDSAILRTPRGLVSFRQPGRYAVVVGDSRNPTVVKVNQGEATIEGPGISLALSAHQSAEITGDSLFAGIVVAETPDSLISLEISRQPLPPPAGSLAPPPAVLEMTGYDAIANTGAWEQAPEYGRIWYPPVDRDWVPYRHGHWSFVQPWGWTWVDDAPWGFAPSHYGRWVEIGDRWAWCPVQEGALYSRRPYYAPALVTFVGLAAGVGLAASVGWIPLGPREVYRPPYRTSNGYARRMNVTNVTNINNVNINGPRTDNRFINSRATTVVPAVAMQQSLPVAGRALPQAQIRQAGLQPVARPFVQPGPAARTNAQAAPGPRFQARPLTAPGAAPPPQSVAPGPAIQPRPAGAAPQIGGLGRPGAAFVPQVNQPGPNAPGPNAPGRVVPQAAPPPGAVAPPPRPSSAQPFAPLAPRPGPAMAQPSQRPPQAAIQAPAPRPQPAPQGFQPRPQPQPQPQPQAQPAPRPQPAPQAFQPRPQMQPQPQPAPRPQPAPQASQPRPQPQPQQQHQPPPQQPQAGRPAPAPQHQAGAGRACPPNRPQC